METEEKYFGFISVYSAFSGFSRTSVTYVVKKCLSLPSQLLVFALALQFECQPCLAQETRESDMISGIAEELAADETDPEAAATFTEYLSELIENPVKINSGDEEEIARLFFLSPFQVKSIAEYVKSSGKIISVYEIPSITGFDRHIAEMMEPFISLKETDQSDSGVKSVHGTLISNIIFSPGKRDTTTPGSGIKNLTRYKMNSGRFSAGFTAEKDAGEKFLYGSPPLPDFLSANLLYSGKKILKKLILGDYSLRLGEGTCINTSMRSGIRLTQPGYLSCNDNLRPFTSTSENNFFRGVAAELSASKSSLIIFASKSRLDASLGTGEDSSSFYVKSLCTSGLHNNQKLLQNKDNLSATCMGLSYSYSAGNFKAGLNWSETRFSLPFIRDSGNPESVFDFEGKVNRLASANYSLITGKILLFGEASLNNKKSYALAGGAYIRASDRLTINILCDKYTPGFTAFNGNGPRSGSASAPEDGLRAGFSFEVAKNLFILAGTSLTKYPWLRYRCGFPSRATRHEIAVRYLPREKFSLELLYGYRQSMYNEGQTAGVAAIRNTQLKSVRLLFRYNPSEKLAFSSRICLNSFMPGKSIGGMILQDVSFTFPSIPISIWFRYCLFSSDSWDSRIYVYENDLLYNFSIPALSGEGSRSYLLIKAELGRRLEIRAKYGITCISSEKINKNSSEIKLQLKAWF